MNLLQILIKQCYKSFNSQLTFQHPA
jgi:hypothetical protein